MKINNLMELKTEEQAILLTSLKKIEGVEMSYKKMCDAIGLKNKTGEAKIKQLEDMEMFCQLERLYSPTRYVIREVYDKVIYGLKALHQSNKYQLLFEAAIYQAFINNDNCPLWLSNMEMLKLFDEVNENFSYACNPHLMRRMGEEYVYMSSMGQIVYKILRQWTRRRIEFMAKREVIKLSTGYRLYTEHFCKHGRYILYQNALEGSEEEKLCHGLRNRAIDEIMPKNWGGTWVPDYKWLQFEKRVSELTREVFGKNYCDVRLVNVISPPDEKWLHHKLAETYKSLESLTGINKEACRKVLSTTQLDDISNAQRKKFVALNMSPIPPMIFKNELSEKDNENNE